MQKVSVRHQRPFPELPSRRHFGEGWGVKVSVTLAAMALVMVGVLIYQTEEKKRNQAKSMIEDLGTPRYDLMDSGTMERVSLGLVTER